MTRVTRGRSTEPIVHLSSLAIYEATRREVMPVTDVFYIATSVRLAIYVVEREETMKTKYTNKGKGKSTKRSVTAVSAATDLVKLGQELLAQQRAIRERIPDFVLPHPSLKPLTGPAAGVSEATVNEGLAMCATHPSLGSAVDAAGVQYGLDYETAFTELRDELQKSFAGLDYSIRLKRHDNGKTMQRVLAMARSLVKAPENAGLAVHIEALRKGFKRRRHQAPETPGAQPAPTA